MITGIISILCYLQFFGTLSASVTAKNENGNFVLKNKNVELVFANGKEFLFKKFRMDGMNILPVNGSTTQMCIRDSNMETRRPAFLLC